MEEQELMERETGGEKKKSKNPRSNSLKAMPVEQGQVGSIVGKAASLFRMPKCKSDEEIGERLEWYFTEYARGDTFPTVEGMALALGVHRDTLNSWEHGECCTTTRSDMIKRAKSIIAECDAQLATHGVMPQVVYIFRSKNYYGMRDQVETVATIQPIVPAVDTSSVVERYRDDMQL